MLFWIEFEIAILHFGLKCHCDDEKQQHHNWLRIIHRFTHRNHIKEFQLKNQMSHAPVPYTLHRYPSLCCLCHETNEKKTTCRNRMTRRMGVLHLRHYSWRKANIWPDDSEIRFSPTNLRNLCSSNLWLQPTEINKMEVECLSNSVMMFKWSRSIHQHTYTWTHSHTQTHTHTQERISNTVECEAK